MSNSVTKKLERVKELLKEPLPPTGESEMSEVKKGPKKAAKKVEKKESKSAGDRVSLVDLAKKADITPQRARQKLREAGVEREGRWSWEKGSKTFEKAKKALGIE
jgi:hypothetical protein